MNMTHTHIHVIWNLKLQTYNHKIATPLNNQNTCAQLIPLQLFELFFFNPLLFRISFGIIILTDHHKDNNESLRSIESILVFENFFFSFFFFARFVLFRCDVQSPHPTPIDVTNMDALWNFNDKVLSQKCNCPCSML